MRQLLLHNCAETKTSALTSFPQSLESLFLFLKSCLLCVQAANDPTYGGWEDGPSYVSTNLLEAKRERSPALKETLIPSRSKSSAKSHTTLRTGFDESSRPHNISPDAMPGNKQSRMSPLLSAQKLALHTDISRPPPALKNSAFTLPVFSAQCFDHQTDIGKLSLAAVSGDAEKPSRASSADSVKADCPTEMLSCAGPEPVSPDLRGAEYVLGPGEGGKRERARFLKEDKKRFPDSVYEQVDSGMSPCCLHLIFGCMTCFLLARLAA